jgi:hypothetical protein
MYVPYQESVTMYEHAYISTIFTSVLGQLVVHMSRKSACCILSRCRLPVDRRGYDGQPKGTICHTCEACPSV